MVAEIIIGSSVRKLNKVFDYNIPEKFINTVFVGTRVLVSFGNAKRLEEGQVVKIKEKSTYKVKDIEGIVDEFCISSEKLELANWMSKKYFCNVYDVIKLILPPGTTTKNSQNRVRSKKEKCVFLNKSVEEVEFDIETKKIKAEKHIKILELLKDLEGLSLADICEIAQVTQSVIKTLEKHEYVRIEEVEIYRNPFINKKIERVKGLKLTNEQQSAFNEIKEDIEKNRFNEFLLHGVTGSGKTEIYLQLINEVIKIGKSAIVLVPEISLTPQMVDRFLARFGDVVSVLHSKLSIGERYDQWRKIYSKESKIIIGARSAIFAPVEDLGIVIIDEEHDMSYKSETTPRYNAKEVACYICKQKNIPLILGSATPDICSYYKTTIGKSKILKLNKRANNASLPEMNIIDMREELENGNRSIFSQKLRNEILTNLGKKEQTILFLNRRGYSTFVICRDCGYTAKCNYCNISLTYHSHENKLKCHYCGYETQNYVECPSCNSKNIRHFGTGTQKIEDEIKKIFPNASTIRMDVDTTGTKNAHENILNQFKNENIDILIGTQMIVKGHHFPRVTLVGVLAADTSLNIEDYRANERTYQILTQVARTCRERKIRWKSCGSNI